MMIQANVFKTIQRWDVFAFQRIVSSRLHATMVNAARWTSRTGDGWAYIVIPAVLYLHHGDGSDTFFVACVVAGLVERAMYFLAKQGFRRRRPPDVVPGYRSHIVPSDEFSFPSGHSSAAFLMATLLVMVYGPAFSVLYLWSAAVGLSRVILGVHFPTDILVGALMGSAIAIVVASGVAA